MSTISRNCVAHQPGHCRHSAGAHVESIYRATTFLLYLPCVGNLSGICRDPLATYTETEPTYTKKA